MRRDTLSDSPSWIGQDARVREMLRVIEDVAATDAPVLITGESGTGKELVARELHSRSRRRARPFVPLNCGAITESLVESELFGHVPGAFTGAVGRKCGKVESADGGTLFLDEVGETSAAFQVKLLRTLQSGEYSPVGMAETRTCDVRVVAATNRDLERSMLEGTFRRDFYYRLSVIRVEVPALRDRPGDIPLLVRHFAHKFATTYGRDPPEITRDFEALALRYHWPGNVRELENVVHMAVILSRGGPLSAHLLPRDLRASVDEPRPGVSPAANFHDAKQDAVERFERDYLVGSLRDCGGIVSRAAARSGLSERNFHEKLRRYGIDAFSFRETNRRT